MKVSKVDLKSKNFQKELYDSLANTGFAILTNHGIESFLLDSVYSEWADFFNSSAKFEYISKNGSSSGYFPLKSENAKGYNVKDLKEFYHIFDSKDMPLGFSFGTEILKDVLEELGLDLLSDLSEEYLLREGQDLNFFGMALQSKNTLLRVLHYPPLGLRFDGEEVRAAPHEDINLITLLPAATFPGLSVKDNDGNWHMVDSDPGSLIVNIGDMLKEATGGKLKSTTHKVLNPTGLGATVSRYSSPLFIHARPEVRLSERYTAEEYLDERLKEIGLKK
jgi:isopenicillin N synthase-like dioxygenase